MSAFVCVTKRCGRGCVGKPTANCPYGILHALDVRGGFQERPRRTGKTRELVAMVKELAAFGTVFFITYRQEVGQRVCGGMHPNVEVFGYRQVMNGCLRGREPGFVIMDELRPDMEMKAVMPFLGGHEVVAAYWSDR